MPTHTWRQVVYCVERRRADRGNSSDDALVRRLQGPACGYLYIGP